MGAAPGFYQGRLFPWLNDRLCADPQLVQLRAGAVAAARGRVIEIGIGTGLNLAHYGPAVTEVVGIEPNPGMLERAQPRIATAAFPVKIVQAPAEALPFDDASFDTAVSTLTLCSVADPARVLAELRRVLRPGGTLLVLEHGLADDPAVARWQQRLDWLQTKFACGCHLNRPVARSVESQGFRFVELRESFLPKMPRTHGWVTIGRATSPPPPAAPGAPGAT